MTFDTSSTTAPHGPTQSEYLEVIRQGMIALPATGPQGFEGLIAELLTAICHRPYRLAKSGSQGGRDGDDGAVYFEAKRYEGNLKRTTVSDKLLELHISDIPDIELFVLAATCEVSAQHRDFYTKACRKIGIELLLLDWNTIGTPALCILMSLEPDTARRFFYTYLADSAGDIMAALATQTALPGTQALGATMRAQLTSPLASLSSAVDSARQWFTKVFASRPLAQQHFHQPLTPLAVGTLPYRDREILSGQLSAAFSQPPDGAFWLLRGIEGAGKSWLMAATWSALERPPLLVFVLPEECQDLSQLSNLDEFIARKLAAQSTPTTLGETRERWRRRLNLWHEDGCQTRPRIVIYIDGINQVPEIKWHRWVEAIAPYLEEIGGILVLSSRPDFSRELMESITTPHYLVDVPVWSSGELFSILKTRDIDTHKLPAAVSDALRNPRLLRIAMEVLDNQEIRALDEFNASRLMFEYTRKAQSEGAVSLPPSQFKAALQKLAREFIQRVQRNERDDLHVYGADFDARLVAAAESRFFKPVQWEANHYTIDKDGLSLSLGLWLLQEMERELGNGRDPGAKLVGLLEPIGSLDETAEALLAATMVAFLDPQTSPGISPLLLLRYSISQNRSHHDEPMLHGLTRRHVGSVLDSADLAINHGYTPDDGVIGVLLACAKNELPAWEIMGNRIRQWLVKQSDQIDRVAHPEEEKRRQLTDERRQEHSARVQGLSTAENAILLTANTERLSRDVNPYHKMAFFLLRGQALAPFSTELVAWSLCTSIRQSYYDLHDEFLMLVRHNDVDWPKTRQCLAIASAPLTGSNISPTGRWALIRLLNATGAVDDANMADMIYAELTADRTPEEGWCWREQLCASDPCDPSTLMPDNLGATADRWRGIGSDTLFTMMGPGEEDLFFTDAEVGISRFMPDLAVERYQVLFEDISTRQGLGLRQGIQRLRASSALLPATLQPVLVDMIVACTARDGLAIHSGRDIAFIVHCAVEAILPHLDGKAQLDLFERMHTNEITRLSIEMIEPIDEESLSAALLRALREDNTVKLANVLCLFAYSDSPIGTVFPGVFYQLLHHRDSFVRAHALATVVRTRRVDLVDVVVRSTWSARSLGEGERLEIHAGSRAMALACQLGYLPPAMALVRMSMTLYGLIARGSESGRQTVCGALNLALRRVLGVHDAPALAEIEEEQGSDDDLVQRSMLARTTFPQDVSPDAEDGEKQKAWDAQQSTVWQGYFHLDRILTAADAQLALHHVSQECVESLVQSYPEVVEDWLACIERAGHIQQRLAVHFWQQLVMACSHVRGQVEPLSRLAALEPITNVVREYRGPKWFTWMLWRDAHLPEVRARCFHRLDTALTDAAIAAEVYAAEDAGSDNALDDYLDLQLSAGEPLNLCRALMIAGYRDSSSKGAQLLKQFAAATGMVGEAWVAAHYATERNLWSYHWFKKMKTATTVEQFWLASKLFLKIADVRYRHWEKSMKSEQIFSKFFPTIRTDLYQRLDRWEKLRGNKLYGAKLPWWDRS